MTHKGINNQQSTIDNRQSGDPVATATRFCRFIDVVEWTSSVSKRQRIRLPTIYKSGDFIHSFYREVVLTCHLGGNDLVTWWY